MVTEDQNPTAPTVDEAKIAEVNSSVLAAPTVDLLGDPIKEDVAAPTVEERLAAIEAKLEHESNSTDSLLIGVESRFKELDAKIERIAAGQPRNTHPRTLDELPSPFAS